MTQGAGTVVQWRASALRAIAHGHERTMDIAIGGQRARLRVAHDALAAQITPAFTHIADHPNTELPTLDIAVWDGLEQAPQSPDWTATSTHPYQAQAPHRILMRPAERTACMFDAQTGWAGFWSGRATELEFHDRAAPLRTILHWWLQPLGLQLIHAGAIALNDRAALVVGRGGSGKSTTMVAGLLSGLDYLGDDFVVVSTAGGPRVHSLYNSAKLRPASLELLPNIEPPAHLVEIGGEARNVWFVHDWMPERCRTSANIGAILVPTVTSATKTTIRETSPGAALLAAGPPTIVQLPGGESNALQTMANLVRSVPTYHLSLGSDLAMAVAVVREVLTR